MPIPRRKDPIPSVDLTTPPPAWQQITPPSPAKLARRAAHAQEAAAREAARATEIAARHATLETAIAALAPGHGPRLVHGAVPLLLLWCDPDGLLSALQRAYSGPRPVPAVAPLWTACPGTRAVTDRHLAAVEERDPERPAALGQALLTALGATCDCEVAALLAPLASLPRPTSLFHS